MWPAQFHFRLAAELPTSVICVLERSILFLKKTKIDETLFCWQQCVSTDVMSAIVVSLRSQRWCYTWTESIGTCRHLVLARYVRRGQYECQCFFLFIKCCPTRGISRVLWVRLPTILIHRYKYPDPEQLSVGHANICFMRESSQSLSFSIRFISIRPLQSSLTSFTREKYHWI